MTEQEQYQAKLKDLYLVEVERLTYAKLWQQPHYLGAGGGIVPAAELDLLLNFSANSPQANPFAGTVVDPSSVSEWNTFFNLPTKGTPFTSVLVSGDIVILKGATSLKIKTNLFENALYIKQIVDAGCVTEIESYGLSKYPVSTLDYAVFPNLITIGDGAFFNTALTVIDFPKVKTVGVSAFHDCYNVTTVNLPEMISCDTDSFQSIDAVTSIAIPSCQNLGETVDFNSVFNDVSGRTITLTVPAALMTCNAGGPDGDIAYLQANNTVTVITV